MSRSFAEIRKDFPALTRPVNGKPLVYLDSAASALKPKALVDAMAHFYAYEASNVHRGIHSLSAQATARFEEARIKVQKFIGAGEDREIVLTGGTTDSINLLAGTWGRKFLEKGDVIVLSEMEHHSNTVPWQMLAEEKGLRLKFIPVTAEGMLDLNAYGRLLGEGAKLVAVSHCSNTLGTINPVKEMAVLAHRAGALIAVDGAQSVTCMPIDVRELDCDFFSFSGHKLFGPYGIGVLYGKAELLEQMPPYRGGGSMISEVTLDGSTYNDIPFRFEAGTPNISGVIGLGAAIDYVRSIGMDRIYRHEQELSRLAVKKLSEVDGVKIYGPPENRTAIFSFTVDGLHANDIGEILDQEGIAVRTGHHCTQPLMKRYRIQSTVRASFSIYNNEEDIEALCRGLRKAKDLLQ